MQNEWVICRVFQKSSGGKKTPISGIVRLGNFGNEIGSSGLPPLMDSSTYSAKSKQAQQSSNVPCFSNPSMDVLRNQEGIVDSINNSINNNTLFSISPNPTTNVFPRNPLSNSIYSTQAVPISGNPQFQSSVLMQDQSILSALLENQSSNLRQKFKAEREMVSFSQETVLTSEMNNEISSVMSNLEMGIRRPFGDHQEQQQQHPSVSGPPVDLFWNY